MRKDTVIIVIIMKQCILHSGGGGGVHAWQQTLFFMFIKLHLFFF